MTYVPHDPTLLITTLDTIVERLDAVLIRLVAIETQATTTASALSGIAGRGGASESPIFVDDGLL